MRIVLWACGNAYKIVMLAPMPVNLKKLALILLLCNLPLGQPAMAEETAQKEEEKPAIVEDQEQEKEEKKQCLPPEAPGITDGRTARKQQIQEMRKAVETYITDNFNYRLCLEEEFNVLNKIDAPKAKSLKAAVEEAITDSLEMDHLVADTFNTQLRIYKSLQE